MLGWALPPLGRGCLGNGQNMLEKLALGREYLGNGENIRASQKYRGKIKFSKSLVDREFSRYRHCTSNFGINIKYFHAYLPMPNPH